MTDTCVSLRLRHFVPNFQQTRKAISVVDTLKRLLDDVSASTISARHEGCWIVHLLIMSRVSFGRALNNKKTNCLFIGNCGPGLGVQTDEIAQLLANNGVAEIVVPQPDSAFVFAVFPSTLEAEAAVGRLDGRPSPANGRALVLRYSEMKQQQVLAPRTLRLCA